MTPDRRKRIGAILWFSAAMTFVLAAYAFYASYGEYEFHSHAWDQLGSRPADGYYASQSEGFLRGQLSMAHEPDPRLMAMANPYDYAAREKDKIPYLWDASYLNGRYYLYFTPVPAVFFYLPHRLAYGAYPADQLAGAVFAAWAFIMSALFIRRALAGRTLHVPLPLWIVMLGVGNVVAVVMLYCRTYEVAALSGMAMTSTWAWSLLRFLESPRTSRLVWCSIWLALAIAARPNLGVLLPVLAYVVFIRRREDLMKAAAIALIPLAIAGSSLLWYNWARFRNPLEFGHRYQLTYQTMWEHRVCSCRTPREALRLVNTAGIYVATPLLIGGDFPFVRMTMQNLDWTISFNQFTDRLGGLGTVVPLAVIGSLLALLLALRREEPDAGTRAAILVVAGGWLALLGLSACWFASARYEIDFMMLITTGAIVCVEAGLTWLDRAGVRVKPLRAAAIALACASIVIGLLLGFTGEHDAFANGNPELFKRLSDVFK